MNRWLLRMLVGCCLAAAAATAADFPRQINYQGRVTDVADVPVNNPAADVEFRLFDALSGGTEVWNELAAVEVEEGLFSHVLGSTCELCQIPASILFADDTLWLEVVFEGETISPRTMLTASPLAYRVASVDKSTGGTITGEVVITGNAGGNQLEVTNSGFGRGGFFSIANGANTEPAVQGTHVGAGPGGSFFSDGGGPGLRASSTFGDAAEFTGNVSTAGSGFFTSGTDTSIEINAAQNILRNQGGDGNGENWRLWGSTFGQLLLYNAAVANDQQVSLSALTSGGALTLFSNGGNDIALDATNSGDNAVIVPVNAINAGEILNEAGTASNNAGSQLLGAGATTVLSRSLTCPSSGYVIVMATGSLNLSHTNGGISQSSIWVTDDELVSLNKPRTSFTTSGNAPSGNYEAPYAVTGVFSVSSGVNTFYVRGAENSGGNVSAQNNQLSLLFVPTAYGFVAALMPSAGLEDPALQPYDQSDERAATEQLAAGRVERELASLQAQLDALKAKLAAEEAGQVSSFDQR